MPSHTERECQNCGEYKCNGVDCSLADERWLEELVTLAPVPTPEPGCPLHGDPNCICDQLEEGG